MIEKTEFRKNYKGSYSGEWAIVICDDCNKKFERLLKRVEKYQDKYNGKQLCMSCAFSKKYKRYKNGKNSKFFKHGISQHGYRRIYHNGKNCYEHKVVAENKLGRPIKRGEIIHHIDCDKLNNHPDNLYIFPSRKEHEICHSNMEIMGQRLFKKYIWFNSWDSKYQITPCKDFDPKNVYGRVLEEKEYEEFSPKRIFRSSAAKWIFIRYKGEKKAQHICIIEKLLGRELFKSENIHHINGDKFFNRCENLFLTTRKKHRSIHESLCFCIGVLFRNGILSFDNGQYYMKGV